MSVVKEGFNFQKKGETPDEKIFCLSQVTTEIKGFLDRKVFCADFFSGTLDVMRFSTETEDNYRQPAACA